MAQRRNAWAPDGPSRAIGDMGGSDTTAIPGDAQLHLESVLSAVRDFSAPPTVSAILQYLVDCAASSTGATSATLLVQGPDLTPVRYTASETTETPLPPASPVEDALLQHLLGRPDALRVDDIAGMGAEWGMRIESACSRPLLGVQVGKHGEASGILYLVGPPGAAFSADHEGLTSALAGAAAIALENDTLRQQAERREGWLKASIEITAELLAGVDGHAAMHLIAQRARAVAHADTVGVSLPVSEDMLIAEVVVGARAEEMQGELIPQDESLSGLVFRTGQAQIVHHLDSDPRSHVSTPLKGLGPAVLVPLAARGEILGVLAVSNAPGGTIFTSADVEMLSTFAAHAAVAITLVKAQEAREQLAVYEERDRIALDLHDLAIQRMFGVGLELESLRRRSHPQELAERLKRMSEDLDRAIGDIRTTIFAIQRPSNTQISLARQLIERVSDATVILGFTPDLRITGAVESVPDRVMEHVIAVVSEGLSNTARHAHASSVIVEVAATGREVQVQISDDGNGPPVSRHRSGLDNLARRAERLGGTFSVEGAPGQGTRLRWGAPLSP